jgi:hypothetical protein
MRHLLLWFLACVLSSSVVAAEFAWVDPDIIKAYEWATGKNYADEIGKLTGIELPSSGALESPIVGSGSGSSGAPGDNAMPRGIVDLIDNLWQMRAYVTLAKDGANLESLGLRADRWVNDSLGAVTFPVESLPRLSVLKGVLEIFLGNSQQIYLGYGTPIIDGNVPMFDSGHHVIGIHAVAFNPISTLPWIEPPIIRAYQKVMGKSFAEEVANLTGGNLGALQKWYRAEWPWQISDALVKGRTVVADESDYLSVITQHSDGMYLHVYMKYKGDVRDLENIDPCVYVDRIGDKVFIAGNTLSIQFPLTCLPEVSCIRGVSEINSPGEVQVPRPIKIQIEDRVKTQKVK